MRPFARELLEREKAVLDQEIEDIDRHIEGTTMRLANLKTERKEVAKRRADLQMELLRDGRRPVPA